MSGGHRRLTRTCYIQVEGAGAGAGSGAHLGYTRPI